MKAIKRFLNVVLEMFSMLLKFKVYGRNASVWQLKWELLRGTDFQEALFVFSKFPK